MIKITEIEKNKDSYNITNHSVGKLNVSAEDGRVKLSEIEEGEPDNVICYITPVLNVSKTMEYVSIYLSKNVFHIPHIILAYSEKENGIPVVLGKDFTDKNPIEDTMLIQVSQMRNLLKEFLNQSQEVYYGEGYND